MEDAPEQPSTGEIIRLPRHIANRIFDHVRGKSEQEVCGLIAARDGLPIREVPIPNVAHQPEWRYRMDPRSLVKTLCEIETRGEELFAIYHSHPRGPSVPSSIDVAEAQYPRVIYFIVSLNTKGVLELRGFRIRDGQAWEVELEIHA